MAIMIPDRCPYRASSGEKRLFAILQNLPDDYYIYYEPVIGNRYPDFILLCPDLGVLIAEVKGWRQNDLVSGDTQAITIREPGGTTQHRHPIRQAREYMYDLMDRLRKLPGGQRLLDGPGEHENRFRFPFSHFVVLSNITAEQLTRSAAGDMSTLFPPSKVITRDQLLTWEAEEPSEAQLKDRLKSCFDPFWPIEPLRDDQIDLLRAAIHPEVLINTPSKPSCSPENARLSTVQTAELKVLDARQEINARSIGSGHRIVYGIAGSGKTVLLIAKARLIAKQEQNHHILLVCYNVALASYLKLVLSDCKNVMVTHFDGWAKSNGIGRRPDEDSQSLGHRLLATLESGQAHHSRFFRTILVDEAQDFETSWYKCLLAAIDDPDDGDLIIVGDGSQGLYGNKKIVWKQIGIHAQGRTISKKFDLEVNYRNSREILELAAAFASKSNDPENEETLVSLEVDPGKCKRSTGVRPHLLRVASPMEEVQQVMRVVKGLLDGDWFGQTVEPLRPEQIAIFYPYVSKRNRHMLEQLVSGLEQLAPAVWINRDPSQRNRIAEQAIKIQTIHSAKGLQYRAVIVMWSDLLPKQFGDTAEEDERKLMYVALTRPEDLLVLTTSRPSPFIMEIRDSGKAVEIDLSHY